MNITDAHENLRDAIVEFGLQHGFTSGMSLAYRVKDIRLEIKNAAEEAAERAVSRPPHTRACAAAPSRVCRTRHAT